MTDTPTARSRDARVKAWPAGWRTTIFRAIGLVLIVGWKLADPIGLDQATTKLILKLEDRVAGATYPRHACILSCGDYSPGRDRILVLLFDDKFRSRMNRRWPLPQDYAALVDGLRRAGARALVVDILLGAPAPPANSLQPLFDSMWRAKAAGMPVIVGQKTTFGDAPVDCADGTRRPGGSQDPGLVCAAAAIGQIGWRSDSPVFYPLYVGNGEPTASPSLAWATYLQLSGRVGAHAGPRGRELADDMTLLWGRPDADSSGRCADPAAYRAHAGPAGMPRPDAAPAMPPEGQTGPCTYLPRLSAYDLLSGDKGATGLVKGRTVFVSLGFRDMEDYVDPPPGGRLPGVFMHATALDNLLTLGSDGYVVYRNPEHYAIESSSWFALVAYGFAWATDHPFERLRQRRLVAWTSWHRAAPSRMRALTNPVVSASYFLGIFLIKIIVLLIVAWLCGLAPFNALATIIICLIIEETTTGIARFKEGKPGHASATE
jgi:hypothetical protein